jgi:outer membrane protein OmpA-like peptidoglycan-associated protein
LGFTDDPSSEDKNTPVSKERAKAVADQLRARGLTVQTVDGFGSAMPVVSAEHETRRNQRVEVWLR